MDCLESDDLFVVFIPDGNLSRDNFNDLAPLLRQSLVAACAALETYVADKAMGFIGSALAADELPSRMRDITLTIGHWADIEGNYKRRVWGIRPVIDEYLREKSSTAPNVIGEVLSTVGVKNWARRVDEARKVTKGMTVNQLDEITERRNRIAHSADRKGRAPTGPEEIERHLQTIRSVVDAIESLLKSHHV